MRKSQLAGVFSIISQLKPCHIPIIVVRVILVRRKSLDTTCLVLTQWGFLLSSKYSVARSWIVYSFYTNIYLCFCFCRTRHLFSLQLNFVLCLQQTLNVAITYYVNMEIAYPTILSVPLYFLNKPLHLLLLNRLPPLA